MNVAFYLTGGDQQGYLFADRLMRSVRETMPEVRCVQLTDEKSAAVWGVDEIRRKPAATLSLLRSAHYAALDGEWLLVDTDVIVQRDIRDVFKQEFDVAVTDRNWPHVKQLHNSFTDQMPYCAGVVFSRNKAFWADVHERVKAQSSREQEWFGDQRCIADAIRSGKWKYIELPGAVYQYPPNPDGSDDSSQAAIVHYKGPKRKPRLINRINRENFARDQAAQDVLDKIRPAAKWDVPQQQVLRVFIGYDSRQPIAEAVCAHSVTRHSSRQLAITPLILSQLPLKRRGLTEFTYSRFLVPYLSGYQGQSLFLDSDILCRADVHELLAYSVAYPEIPVFVVEHTGKNAFERPSVMLFNNEHCRNLTPAFVEDTRNLMFDMKWAEKIGPLPSAWNHLVGYDDPRPDAKIVHFTKGIPVWPEVGECEYSDEWRQEHAALNHTVSFQELMGGSVHVNR